MFFNEIYGVYYNTISKILSEAISKPISNDRLIKIIEEYAFNESIVYIPLAIKEERWQILKEDGTTPIKNKPSLPLTFLQKQWLKSILLDPRIKLFGDIDINLDDVTPLFLPDDVIIFDKYSDGDNYTQESYIKNFRLILDAIKNKYPLNIKSLNKKGNIIENDLLPEYLEYSEKDDKFRLIGLDNKLGVTINLNKIISCKMSDKIFEINNLHKNPRKLRSVIFELIDTRQALERVLLHFAHFRKTAERIDENKYIITIYYDKDDESEIVIRILSFSPMIKVINPPHFINLIRKKLIKQKSCDL